MLRFMCIHSLPPGQMKLEQVKQITKAAQKDPKVKGYRSFMNLTEGKIVCILDAPDQQSVTSWFAKMNIPYDTVSQVELEGDRGRITEHLPAREHAVV